ncbi:hypothetical protein SORBI_3004G081000 [Sorghum bicolor]|uniref:Uncharacterized protein n=1 Tax=Sorghum bicolor TaxID=4558 RepID=A0A194YPF9_SORBI|nr:hypothetical protein SORBI_3004G081000 [Sorghum bicolor]
MGEFGWMMMAKEEKHAARARRRGPRRELDTDTTLEGRTKTTGTVTYAMLIELQASSHSPAGPPRRQKQRSLRWRATTLTMATAAAAAAAVSATGSSGPPLTKRPTMRQATRSRGRHQSTKSSAESRSTSHCHTLSMAIDRRDSRWSRPEEARQARTDGAGAGRTSERARTPPTRRGEKKKKRKGGTSEQLAWLQLDQGVDLPRRDWTAVDGSSQRTAQAGGEKRGGFLTSSSGGGETRNRSIDRGLVAGRSIDPRRQGSPPAGGPPRPRPSAARS